MGELYFVDIDACVVEEHGGGDDFAAGGEFGELGQEGCVEED